MCTSFLFHSYRNETGKKINTQFLSTCIIIYNICFNGIVEISIGLRCIQCFKAPHFAHCEDTVTCNATQVSDGIAVLSSLILQPAEITNSAQEVP